MTFTKCQFEKVYRGKMETVVGIIKEVDKLGRIVIPKDFRDRFALGDRVEIIGTASGIILRNPEYKLVKVEDVADKSE